MKGAGRGALQVRTPLTKTTGIQYSDLDKDGFVPGWDSKPGAQQKAARIKPRAALGPKMTPKLGGKLIPSKR